MIMLLRLMGQKFGRTEDRMCILHRMVDHSIVLKPLIGEHLQVTRRRLSTLNLPILTIAGISAGDNMNSLGTSLLGKIGQ